MAVVPAAPPIRRSRSRRLGDGTAELFSIPTSAVNDDSRATTVGGGREDVHLSHEARPQSRRTRRGRRAPARGERGEPRVQGCAAIAANLARSPTSFRFLYYTRDIKKWTRRGWQSCGM